ncbi:MAG: alpha/beta fold hydrolase [Candidatus Kariarchaeaceae archaeon]
MNDGKIHLKGPKKPNSKNPFVVFLHGASPQSQHTEFWTPILDKIVTHCNPILVDRFGHGKSEIQDGVKIGIKTQITSMISLVDHVLEKYQIDNVALIGRSQGGGFATRLAKEIPQKISALGLIAPGSMKTNYANLSEWNKPVALLWDIDDPVVNFSNFDYITQVIKEPVLFTIGEPAVDVKFAVSHEGIKKSHAPELTAPDLFEAFIKHICDNAM